MPEAETAQPTPAAETTLEDLGEAFKVSLGQVDPRPRDEQGRFAKAEEPVEGEEIEAGAEGETPEAEAESQEAEERDDEAPDEGQPEDVALPASWPKEQAETWQSLPPETRAFIAEREGQRDAAVNAKFQEAANVKKANEALIAEAQTSRQQAVEVTDMAISLIQPHWPSPTMLDINSSDYDPDQYHLQTAKAQQAQSYLMQLASQRDQLSAQAQQEAQTEMQRHVEELNQATAPAFIKDYPEAADQTKAQAFFNGLVEFAMKAGAPADFFQNGPVSAIEWHIIADAKRWRDMQAAKAKVKAEPKPEQRKPAIRPGVTTPRSAVEQRNRKAASERLARSGSVEDAAAVFKDMFKGTFT